MASYASVLASLTVITLCSLKSWTTLLHSPAARPAAGFNDLVTEHPWELAPLKAPSTVLALAGEIAG
jgi:hypothetical protein